MIKRHYFYQLNIVSEDPKFMWGVVSVKSWFPEPWIATQGILSDAKEMTGATDRQVKIVTFNKV